MESLWARAWDDGRGSDWVLCYYNRHGVFEYEDRTPDTIRHPQRHRIDDSPMNPSYPPNNRSPQAPNFQLNSFYLGDNIDVLRSFDSETVDLIATDPPFNNKRDAFEGELKGGGKAKFKDNWHWVDPDPTKGKRHDPDAIENHPDWLESIRNLHPKVYALITATRDVYGDDMAAFLCWIGVRLLEMRRVLKPTGSIYLHCDPTASHYLKGLMDAVFGRKNFRNEIVWGYRGGGVPKVAFARKHDTILSYAKNIDIAPFNRQFTEYSDASQKLVKSRGGVSIDNKVRDLDRGAAMPDWWVDINSLQTWSPERTGYPTQKPLALYKRIVRASSNRGDIVLDPFAGCATTAVAAQSLRRNWVAIDIEGRGYNLTKQRMSDERTLDQQTIVIGPAITDLPPRTDDGRTAADPLNPKPRKQRAPSKIDKDRDRKLDILIDEFGLQCWGCGFDPAKLGTAGERYGREFFELDHIKPQSARGNHDILNRAVLCGPCNRRKGGFGGTLTALREDNETAQRLYGPLLRMEKVIDWHARYDPDEERLL